MISGERMRRIVIQTTSFLGAWRGKAAIPYRN